MGPETPSSLNQSKQAILDELRLKDRTTWDLKDALSLDYPLLYQAIGELLEEKKINYYLLVSSPTPEIFYRLPLQLSPQIQDEAKTTT